MKIVSHFGRNNIPMRHVNNGILKSSTSNYQKNRDNMNYSQEIRFKERQNIIINNININNIKKSPKYSNNINLIFDCKKNCNKKSKIGTNNINCLIDNSIFDKSNKFDYLNSKIDISETEPNIINKDFYKKIENNKNKLLNNELLFNINKLSTNLLSKFYTNKKEEKKISIKKNNKNFSVNFNDKSPNSKAIKLNNNNGRNINLDIDNNNIKSSNNKHNSFSNINHYINKEFPDLSELTKENLSKIKSEISIKNKKKKNYQERNNLYLKRPLSSFSSSPYLKDENDINLRNNSYNNKFNTNYNLMNITSIKERKNSFTNINKINFQNYFPNSKSRKNSDIQDNKELPTKIKDNYSFNHYNNKINKLNLNQFYEHEFNNNNNQKINIKFMNNYNKSNNDDIIYKNKATTNKKIHSNILNKVKNLKKYISYKNKNNNSENEKIENIEELHYFFVSSIQKGKNYDKIFN